MSESSGKGPTVAWESRERPHIELPLRVEAKIASLPLKMKGTPRGLKDTNRGRRRGAAPFSQ